MEAPDDLALFEAPRTKRMALAKAQGVPPYVISHDSTLLAMAQERARELDAFARLTCVGGAKLTRYAQIASRLSHITINHMIARKVRRTLADAGQGDAGRSLWLPAYLRPGGTVVDRLGM